MAGVHAGCRGLLALLSVASVAFCGHPNDTPAKVTFSNPIDSGHPAVIFWQKPAPSGMWPPAPPENHGDFQRVRCYLARRGGTHVGEDTRDDLKRDLVRKGEFVITVRKDWAPKGAERFLHLVGLGFFNALPLFRAVQNFLVQFGVSTDHELQKSWGKSTITDDPLKPELLPLPPGTLAFAGSGANSRTSQVWLSFGHGVAGKQPWETPVGYVHSTDGLSVVQSINTEYGDLGVFGGKAPDPHALEQPGAVALLRTKFPNIDYFESCATIDGDLKDVVAHSGTVQAADAELVQIEAIPPGEKRTLNTATGHVFVAKRAGERLGQVRVNQLDQTFDLRDGLEL